MSLYVLAHVNMNSDRWSSGISIDSVYSKKKKACAALKKKLKDTPVRPDERPVWELQEFEDGGKRIFSTKKRKYDEI